MRQIGRERRAAISSKGVSASWKTGCASRASLSIRPLAHTSGRDRFDGAMEDIFDLQEKMSTIILGAIAPKLRSLPRSTGRGASPLKALTS